MGAVLHRHHDPLLRDFEFQHEIVFHPYGFPVRFHSNARGVLEAAAESFAAFDAAFADYPEMQVYLGVTGEEQGPMPPAPTVRAMNHLLTITGDAEHAAVCDFEAGGAYCWVTPRMLNDRAAMRFYYLDAMAYSLVCERYLTGIHGSCVAVNGRGALLCGDSNAGKSTLAYACARRGLTYINDDGSFLLRESSDRMVLGNPHSIRFRPSAVELFPELSVFVPAARANGKMSIEIATSRLPIPNTAGKCRVEKLLFLRRTEGARARMVPYNVREAYLQLEKVLTFGRDSAREEQRASLERVLAGGVWEFVYSDLNEAVDVLQSLLR